YVKEINITATGYEGTDPLTPLVSSTDFTQDPSLISHEDDFILSGLVGETYQHVLYDGSTLIEYTTPTVKPIVAFAYIGTDLIAVLSDGSVWINDTSTTLDMVTGSVILPSSYPENQPYPIFTDDTHLYIQDESYDFYKIDAAGSVTEVTAAWTDEFDNIEIKSYLKVGSIVYVGTQTNGIFEFDLL
ncbi:MAG: hypothetical protein AB7S52_12360, partial [Sphaerochaetaceae bacterium]